MEQAYRKLQAGEQDQALALLRAATKKAPHLPPARLMLARLLLARNQPARGRIELERAATEEAAYPGIYLTFGELALAEGRLTDSIVQFEKALAIDGTTRWPRAQIRSIQLRSHLHLAIAAARRNDWPIARTHLLAYLDGDPGNGGVRQHLGQVLFELGDPDKAYEEFKRAAKDDPKLEAPGLSIAWLYTGKGDLKKAATWVDRTVRDHTGDGKVQRGAAWWYLGQGNLVQAQSHAEITAKLDPNSKSTKVLLGTVARYRKDYPRAESLFEMLHREWPNDPSPSSQLVLVLIEQNDPIKQQRALHLAEFNGRLHPRSLEALAALGWVYFRLGRLEDAEVVLRRAVSGGDSATREATYYLARVVAERNRPDEARRLLQNALHDTGSFALRRDAQEWLKRLRATPGSRP